MDKMKKIIGLADRMDEIERKIGDCNTDIRNLREEVFEINEGDIATARTIIAFNLKMAKLLDSMKDGDEE